MKFTEQERSILRIVQENLPQTATPYEDVARQVGCTEADVLALLTRMREDGSIRRFGASIKHQKTGWNNNAMVAWQVREDGLEAHVDECGQLIAKHKNVSHCYFRPSPTSDWPYTLYTMIHGRSEQECRAVIEDIQKSTGIENYAVLESLQELKKSSMMYF